MAAQQLPDKDPGDTVDFPIDFSPLLASSEQISSVMWTVPAGLTNVLEEIDGTGKFAILWLSGGTAGVCYRITASVVTDASPQARTFERDFILKVKEI